MLRKRDCTNKGKYWFKCIRPLAYTIALVPAIFGILVGAVYADASSTIGEDKIQAVYADGREVGIINPANMSYAEFHELIENSVIPAYEQQKSLSPVTTFESFVAEDNYEVPVQQADDNPTTVSAQEPSKSVQLSNTSTVTMRNTTTANKGYSMEAGDILVVYGTNSDYMGRIVGHAAIATSSGYVLQMTGTGHKSEHWTKKKFFQTYTKTGYVAVYRIKNHPNYSKKAASYAWNHMYHQTEPSYQITTNLYHKSPSYCSKYVYLAYDWGATSSAVLQYPSYLHIVTPHGLIGNFYGSFKPSYIHKITSY